MVFWNPNFPYHLRILKLGFVGWWLNLCMSFIMLKVITIKVGLFHLIGLLVESFDDNLKIYTLGLFEWLIEYFWFLVVYYGVYRTLLESSFTINGLLLKLYSLSSWDPKSVIDWIELKSHMNILWYVYHLLDFNCSLISLFSTQRKYKCLLPLFWYCLIPCVFW